MPKIAAIAINPHSLSVGTFITTSGAILSDTTQNLTARVSGTVVEKPSKPSPFSSILLIPVMANFILSPKSNIPENTAENSLKSINSAGVRSLGPLNNCNVTS